jgi:diguanylate cyclase
MAIDRRPEGFTAQQMRELHRLFGGCADDCRKLQLASQRMGGLVAEVTSKLGIATSHTRDYSARLSSLGRGISSSIEPSELVALVRELEHQTALMRQRAEKLETELERNSREIVHLKDDLASARRAATTDPLTGLGNRQLFNDVFADEAAHAQAERTPLSLLVCDIDHFKQFNDRYGHQIGDAVLKLVADKLKRSVKGRDTVARYGGEEFVVMLPATSEVDAAGLADQLRTEIAKSRLVVRNRGRDLGKVTISIGVAELRRTETPDDCFRRADSALYRAKHAGRNRVARAELATLGEAVPA